MTLIILVFYINNFAALENLSCKTLAKLRSNEVKANPGLPRIIYEV